MAAGYGVHCDRHRPRRAGSGTDGRTLAAMEPSPMHVPAIPAATVVPLRDGPDGLETLMLRRNSKLEFAGGMWVWPGGRIDPGDYPGGAPDDDPAVLEAAARAAAVREAGEEAGIVVDPDSLVWFAHWTPPPISPKRFAHLVLRRARPRGPRSPSTAARSTTMPGGRRPRPCACATPSRSSCRPPTWITLEHLAPFTSVAEAMSDLRAATARVLRHPLRLGRGRRGRPLPRRRRLRRRGRRPPRRAPPPLDGRRRLALRAVGPDRRPTSRARWRAPDGAGRLAHPDARRPTRRW